MNILVVNMKPPQYLFFATAAGGGIGDFVGLASAAGVHEAAQPPQGESVAALQDPLQGKRNERLSGTVQHVDVLYCCHTPPSAGCCRLDDGLLSYPVNYYSCHGQGGLRVEQRIVVVITVTMQALHRCARFFSIVGHSRDAGALFIHFCEEMSENIQSCSRYGKA